MADSKKINWRAQHKQELVEFVGRFYQASFQWRKTAYHAKWDKWERNYLAIYDPDIKAKKKEWQATMFDPSITPTIVELVTNALSKTLIGKNNPLGIKPREMGDELQAELHAAVLDYEVQRSNFLLADYDAKKEACIFGSGFKKIYWNRKWAPKRIQRDVPEDGMRGFLNMGRSGPPKMKTVDAVESVRVADDPVCEKVHIRDIFLEPNATTLDRVLHRNKITYGELLNLSKQKNSAGQPLIDPESVEALLMISEGDKFEEDMVPINAARDFEETQPVRPDYDKRHTVWEYWGPLPRKWIDLDMPEDTDAQKAKANEVLPGKALIASARYYLGSEINPLQGMEPPFVKTDYLRTNGVYGIGIGQLLEGIQDETNEIRNLRVDNVTLAMNKIFGVIEPYLMDPKEVRSSPGQVIRFKSSEVDDVRKAFMELPVSDVALSAFRETGELERKAQEVSGANRVTMGSAGLTNDTNKTLGGMELLRQSAFERFTMYAYIIGLSDNILCAKKLMALSYQNRSPESIKRILGQQPVTMINMDTGKEEVVAKWAAYKKLPPHELELDYDFVFTDVFNAENKAQKLTAIMNLGQFLSSTLKGYDIRPIVKRAAHYNDLAAEEINAILEGIPPVNPTPLGMGQGVPSMPKPTRSQSGGEASPLTQPTVMGPGQ